MSSPILLWRDFQSENISIVFRFLVSLRLLLGVLILLRTLEVLPCLDGISVCVGWCWLSSLFPFGYSSFPSGLVTCCQPIVVDVNKPSATGFISAAILLSRAMPNELCDTSVGSSECSRGASPPPAAEDWSVKRHKMLTEYSQKASYFQHCFQIWHTIWHHSNEMLDQLQNLTNHSRQS